MPNIIQINNEWAILIENSGKREGLMLGKHQVRTTLDPLHIALLDRLNTVSTAYVKLAKEIA